MSNRPTLHQNSNALLRELLEEPGLDQLVRKVPGSEWKAIVRHVGLEDSSELLALSTPEQLVELIDETLWTGVTTDAFDLERFATLLEVLHESGAQALAEKVASLPEEFLTMALGRLISVWPSELLRQLAEADESGILDKRLESHAFEEFDDFTVLSSSGLAWDPLVSLLGSWSDAQPELMGRLLGRLSVANVNSVGEVDELVNVLDEMAEYEEDAQAEREERRARSGYVSISDARAFLRLPAATKPGETDAISAAYFRRLQPEAASPQKLGESRLLEILRRHARTGATDGKRQLGAGSGLLKLALEDLARTAPERHARALEELAFLTNVVLATLIGGGKDAGPPAAEAFRSVVASVETAGLAEIGLEPTVAAQKLSAALAAWGPIALFRNRPR